MDTTSNRLLARYRRLVYSSRVAVVIFVILLLCGTCLGIVEAFQTSFPDFVYTISRSILLTIISSVIIVSAIQFYTSHKNIDMLKQEIGDLFSEKLESSNIKLHGIVQVHDGMPHSLLKSCVRSHAEMFILQTWIADFNVIKENLRLFCLNGGKLRIAILHPKSEFVRLRSKEINSSEEFFSQEIISNLLELKEISNNNIEVKLHEQTPSISVYGFPDVIFVGNYLNRLHAIQGPQLEVKGGYYFEKVLEHFEDVWNKSRTVDDDFLDELTKDGSVGE